MGSSKRSILPSKLFGPPILSDHLVGMHPAAGADDLDELLDIIGDTAKVQTQVAPRSGEYGIFGPGIKLKLVFRL